jgi:hypothetical protein
MHSFLSLSRRARRGGLALVLIPVFSLFAIAATPGTARAGELRQGADAVRGSTPSSPPSSSGDFHERGRRSGSSHEGSVGSSLAAAILEWIVVSPFSVPRLVVEQDAPEGGWSFGEYPYADGASGYLRPNGPPTFDDEGVAHPGEEYRTFAFQAGVEGLASTDGTFGRLQGSVHILTKFRVDLDAAYSLYMERGQTDGVSSAWLGAAHLTYRFAESDHVHFRAGAGIKHWVDPGGWALGPDFVYGIDIFWGRPMTTSLEASAGLLGKGWSTGARASVGVMIGQAELYAGYDGVWIGSPRQPTAFLGGPVAGFRAYF